MDCGFQAPLPPLGNLCFADREREVEALLGLHRRGAAVPVLVYGPEGLGSLPSSATWSGGLTRAAT